VSIAAPAPLVLLVPGVEQRVQLGYGAHPGNRDQVVAAEPADLALHAALLMGPLQAGLAVEGIQAGPGPEGGPPVGLHPNPGEAEHAGHRRGQVVVADLPGRHAAQHAERMRVALEKRLLPLRSRHAVHCLAGEGQPEHEHVTQSADPGQVNVNVAEIDLGVLPGLVGLRDEHLRRPASRLDPDLRLAARDVGPDHRIGDAVPVMLGRQPVKDPLGSVPLLARSIKIGPQDPVDRLFMPVQTGLTRGKLLPRLGPRRGQRQGHGPPAHPVLPGQIPARQPVYPRIPADRRVQLDPRHRLHTRLPPHLPVRVRETPGADPPMPAHRWSQDSPTPGPP